MTSTWWSAREDKDGYYMRPDNAGKTVKDINEGWERLWEDMPLGLTPRVNVQRVVADAMSVVNLQEGKEKIEDSSASSAAF